MINLQILVVLSSKKEYNLKCKGIHYSTKSCLELRDHAFFVNLLDFFLLGTVVDCDIWLHTGIMGMFRKAWTKLFKHWETFVGNSESEILSFSGLGFTVAI